MSGRCRRAVGLRPLLPLLLSLVRGAPPPQPPQPRQLLLQALQGAASNAAPVRPLQALQGAASAPLVALQSAVPVRPLQALQSQLPVRPLQSLQGRPGLAWFQNSNPANALQNAAVGVAVSESNRQDGGDGAPPSRRRRSLDSDQVTDAAPEAEDLLEEAAQRMAASPAPAPGSGEKQQQHSNRQEKALQYLNMGGGFLAVEEMGPPGLAAGDYSALELDNAGLTLADEDGNELLSRAAPFRNRNRDSPIYYIRLPPSPYVLVPGVGYVSSPSRRPLGGLAAPAPPPPPPPSAAASSPFYNLPLAFVSNGKPTGVYQPSWAPAPQQRPPRPPVRPAQPSPMFSLNKGPYVFNGRPSDIFILRDSYDTLYGDTLSSFYP